MWRKYHKWKVSHFLLSYPLQAKFTLYLWLCETETKLHIAIQSYSWYILFHLFTALCMNPLLSSLPKTLYFGLRGSVPRLSPNRHGVTFCVAFVMTYFLYFWHLFFPGQIISCIYQCKISLSLWKCHLIFGWKMFYFLLFYPLHK